MAVQFSQKVSFFRAVTVPTLTSTVFKARESNFTSQFDHFSILDSLQRGPHYSVDIGRCVYTSYFYDNATNEHVFTVEQGCRFFLKLNLSANPPPTSDDVILDRIGQTLQGVPHNSIRFQIDSVDIQMVTIQHDGSYILRSSTSAGEASIQFRIQVQGTYCHTVKQVVFIRVKISLNFTSSFR